MKKNKLLAGLLSFAMVASMLPMMPTAIAETTIPEEPMYSQTFETADDAADYAATSSAWSSEWVSDGDDNGGHMVYTRTDTSEYSGYQDILVQNYSVTLTNDVMYEMGYSFKPESGKFQGYVQSRVGARSIATRSNGTTFEGVTLSDVSEGYIDVKFQFKRTTVTMANGNTTQGLVYTRTSTYNSIAEGGVKTVTSSGTYTQYTGNYWQGLYLREDENGKTAKSFSIDNVYLKKMAIVENTVDFEVDGGVAVESMTAQNGTLVGDLPTTTHPDGYSFDGWYVDVDGDKAYTEGVDTAFDGTGITGDITVVAKWATTVSLTFNANGGAEDEQVVEVGIGQTVETLPTVTRDGYHFVSWNTAADGTGTAFDETTLVTEATTLYAQWQKALKASFVVDDEAYATVEADVDGNITLPTDPEKAGYAFAGWYAGETLLEGSDITDLVDENGEVTFTASWIATATLTLKTSTDGETYADYKTIEVVKNTAVDALPAPTTAPSGMIFDAWYTDEALTTKFDASSAVAEDATLWAGYKDAGYYLYYADFENKTYPEYFNSVRSEWTSDAADGNMTYTKTGTNTYGSPVSRTNTGVVNIALEENVWYETGYKVKVENGNFLANGFGFYIGDNTQIGNTSRNNQFKFADKTLLAYTFAKINGYVTVTTQFRLPTLSGETVEVKTVAEYTATDGTQKIETYEYTATKRTWNTTWKGFYFTDANSAQGVIVSFDDVYLKTVPVTEERIVTYNANGGVCDVETVTTTTGEVEEVTPTREGYRFDGWYVADEDGNATDEAFDRKNVYATMTVIALWTPVYTVTFETYGGTTYDAMTTADGTIDISALVPTKTGVGAFIGWYTADGEVFDGTGITSDMTVYAKYGTDVFKYTFDTEADVPSGFYSTSGWTSVWDESGKMKYTISTTSNNYDTLFSFIPAQSLAKNQWYEVGYTINMTGGTVTRFDDGVTIGNGGKSVVNLGKLGLLSDYKNVDGDIKVTAMFMLGDLTGEYDANNPLYNIETNMTAEYYVDGELVTKKYSEVLSNWESRNNLYKFSVGFAMTGDMTVTVDDFYLSVVENAETYTVTFDADGGVGTAATMSALNGSITGNMPTATKDGYQFMGWYTADGEAFTGKGITGDMTVIAYWAPIYTVTFDTDGGTEVDPISTYTGSITLPTPPTKAGVGILENWYVVVDGVMTDTIFDGTGVTGDMTVKAVYGNYIYKEDFNADYDTAFAVEAEEDEADQRWQSVVEDGKITYTLINAEAQASNSYATVFSANSNKITLDRTTTYEAGYTINLNGKDFPYANLGFYLGDAGLGNLTSFGSFGANSAGNITFAGKVIENSGADIDGDITVKVLFTIDGEGNDAQDSTDQYNGVATAYISYYSGGQIKEHVVSQTFMSHHGQRNSDICTFGGTALAENLSKTAPEAGYEITLDGFYVKIPESNTITFNTMGGDELESITAFAGIIDGELPTPEKADWTFAGWFKDEACINPFGGSIISGDITLYARWQQAPKIVSSTPSDGGYAGSRSPVITLTFDSEVDSGTIAGNVKLYDGDKAVAKSNYIVTSALSSDRKTVVTITVTGLLAYGTTYTVKVNNVANEAGPMEAEYTMDFVSERLEFGVEDVTIKDASSTYESVAAASGKEVTVSFTVKNIAND